MNKSKISNFFIALYFLVAAFDIVGVIFELRILILVFKPLIIPLLAVSFVLLTSKINYWLLLGLFFSFLGDVFLMFEGNKYFMLGLGAFLVAHIVYISIVLKRIDTFNLKHFLIAFIPFAIVFSILIYLTYNNLGEMLIPVIVYGIVICLFGTFSLYYYRKTKTTLALLLVAGTSIFIVSDASIAINMFYAPKEYFDVFIMITYVIAQYLICRALVEGKTP